MSGTIAQSSLEHLSGILSRYETGDLDQYGYDEMATAITSLEAYRDQNSTNEDLVARCGLVSGIISNMYVARGFATTNVPRDLKYYESMNEVRRLIQQVKKSK